MDAATCDLVRRLPQGRCVYSLLPQEHSPLTHHIEHITARQHGGGDDADNVSLACHRCNLRKVPNLAGVDPLTGEVANLFHPRRDKWAEHFMLQDTRIIWISPVGRVTVHVLPMHDPRRMELRSTIAK
jgi:hypothetical protein